MLIINILSDQIMITVLNINYVSFKFCFTKGTLYPHQYMVSPPFPQRSTC